MRVLAASAVFVLVTGVAPTPQAQVLPSVRTAAAVDNGGGEDPPPVCDVDCPGSITITKQNADEGDDGGGQMFTFSTADSDDITMPIDGTGTFENLAPGSVIISETEVPGWQMSNVYCYAGEEYVPVEFEGSSFELVLDSGGFVDCYVVNEHLSNVTYDKKVESVRHLAADEIAVTFTVTVTNEGTEESPARLESYQFFDEPRSSVGIDPTALTLLSVDGAVAGVDFEADDGYFDPGLGLEVEGEIAAEATHVFHIEVTYSINNDEGFWGECSSEPTDYYTSGLTNRLRYRLPDSGEGYSSDFGCVSISQVTFTKNVINDNGGTLSPGDVIFDIKDGDKVLQSGHSGDTVFVASGDYTVVERPVAGYTSDGVSCVSDGGGDDPIWPDSTGGLTTFEPDLEYYCSTTNNDVAADLAIDKTDGNATLIAGGPAVTYTLTVTNAGGSAAVGDDAIVTDVLPAGLNWVAGSVTGCTTVQFAGQTMSCHIPAAAIVPGATIVITAAATLPANGDSGDYVNVATVGNAGDPVPASANCLRSSNNVDCETTPGVRQATITATKVSDASGPKKTGDAVAYTLVVSNAGPSTLLAGTVLTDDLPDGLQLVSASGAGWVCGNVDPVVCSSETVVNPGASLPPIVINTKVIATVNATITNTGVFTAIVDIEKPVLTPAFSAAAAVTVKASATAVASIEVIQESAPPNIGPLPATGGSPQGILLVALSAFALGVFLLRLRRLHPQP